MSEEITPVNQEDRRSFSNLGLVFAGENLLALAKERGNVSSDRKKPVYEFPFAFVGYKFDTVILEGKEPFDAVVFLSPDGKHYSTGAEVIIKDMKTVFEASPFVKKDGAGNLVMQNGFIMTTEQIEPVFTFFEGRGDHGGYAKLL